MKKVILLRHAKSSWNNDSISDFERPLNRRGKLSCKFMKERLWAHIDDDFCVLCSSAKRTRQTAKHFFKDYPNGKPEIRFQDELYHANPDDILNILHDCTNEFDTLIVIGHNPGLSQLSYVLSGEPRNMVTANFAVIEFDFDSWDLIFDGSGVLIDFDYPKQHDGFLKLLDE